MTNPYHKRKHEHAIGRSGRASEKRLNKSIEGRARPASGAMAGAKGDIDLGQVLLEAKSTTTDSFSLTRSVLAKISHEARMLGKQPALAVSFVTENGQPHRNGEWVMIPLADWKLLFQADADEHD